MLRPQPIAKMTYAEYVLYEAKEPQRHEFLGGDVFARAGGTPERGALAAAIHYRRISSLREYVLVAQHEPLIEVYRRTSTVVSS